MTQWLNLKMEEKEENVLICKFKRTFAFFLTGGLID